MIRRLVGAGLVSAGTLAAIPTAFADDSDKYKSVYGDNNQDNVLPGTVAASKPKDTVLSDIEKKVDQTLKPEEVKVGSNTLRFDEALEGYVASSRQYLTGLASDAESYGRSLQNALVGGERSVAQTIAGLKAADEDVLPNAIYILVAGLSGSILARPRGLALRATLPWFFGIQAFAYLMPHTFKNTTDLVWKYEQEVPQLAEAHTSATKQISDLKDQTKSAYESGEQSLKEQVGTLRTLFKDFTGLDISGSGKDK